MKINEYSKGRINVIDEIITLLEKEKSKTELIPSSSSDLYKNGIKSGLKKGYANILNRIKQKRSNTLLNILIEEDQESHVCIQTGITCGYPCYHECPRYKDKI